MKQRRSTVSGSVRYADGSAAAGISVRAVDRDLRGEQPLGRAVTARDGSYEIAYGPEDVRERERGGPDVVVKAVGARGKELGRSAIRFDAPPDAEVDLVLDAARVTPPSLFERLEAIRGLLGGLSVEELDDDERHDDLTFLAGETGLARGEVARFALAHRLAGRDLPPEPWFALLRSSFFTYDEQVPLRDQSVRVGEDLPALDARTAARALDRAFASGDLSEGLRGSRDAWLEALLDRAAARAIDPQTRPFLAGAVDHAGVRGAKKRLKLARALGAGDRPREELLDDLSGDRAFTKAELADLRASLELGEITGAGFDLVGTVKDAFDVRSPEDVRVLARMGEDEWAAFVSERHAKGAFELPAGLVDATTLPVGDDTSAGTAALAGRTLARRLRDAHPTAAFAGALERASDGVRGVQRPETVVRLLDGHPELDLLATPIDEFLGSGVRSEFRSLARDDAFRRELKAVQRVFKLAPRFEATDALLADGLHSAQAVYRVGESEFVRRYAKTAGFDDDLARVAWRRAADTQAAVLTVIGDLTALDTATMPAALPSDASALAAFPNWERLFAAGDVCDCEHCRSVLGPAAYYADLLMFLRERRAEDPALSVRDVLLARRPDLGYLELNCENALTTLPYVDVVCEVLERAIAGTAADAELTGLTSIPTDPAAAAAAVGAALHAGGIDVGASFTLSQIDATRWMVHGDDATYLLEKRSTANFFAEHKPNTKAPSGELRAYPAYVDPHAYDTLRQARFPFALPFDLFGEEVRAALRKAGVKRWELMRDLRGPSAPNDAGAGDVAAERLGLGSDPASALDEKRLVTVADTSAAGQKAAWGETGNGGWLTTLANVETFVAKAGVDYEELLGLLDLAWVNPNGAIAVQHLDDSCDLDRKKLQGLTAARLDRIHRFLRLLRKLPGWSAWELDLAIRCTGLGDGALDETFLVRLADLLRLRDRLGTKTTIEQLCALFDDLPTETHYVKAHARRRESLYHTLFLNRRLVQPLDPAFEVAAVDVAGPTVEKISGHAPVVLAALRLREADLATLAGLTRASDGTPYVTDDLTLANLSFLWRHAWLSRLLKLKADEWQSVLAIGGQDVASFADPAEALAFTERVDELRATGFAPDALGWLLAADRTAKSAPKEAEAARFLIALRNGLQAIRAEHDPARHDFLVVPSDTDRLAELLTSLLQRLHRDEPEARFFVDVLRDTAEVQAAAPGLPAGFAFPAAIADSIRIRYDEPTATLRFTGLMLPAERTKLLNDGALAAVSGIASYQAAVKELFERPRLALRFLEPVFTATLAALPAGVELGALPDQALARRISYDAERRELRLVGLMTPAERAGLDALSADTPYRQAVNHLFTQPTLGAFAPEEIWLADGDLQLPLRDPDPAQDNLAANMAAAITEALAHLRVKLSEELVVRETSAQLALSEAVARSLLSDYAVLGETLLEHLTGPFAATSGAVDRATLPATFDGWQWAHRVAAIWRRLGLTPAELERVRAITPAASLLDFAALPLDAASVPAGPPDRFLRTFRLLRLRGLMPETHLTFLELLERVAAGAYGTTAAFAADVALVDESWPAPDVERLAGAIDVAFATGWLAPEAWERARRVFAAATRLGAGVGTLLPLAAPAMDETHTAAVKQLLNAALGADTWLEVSAEVQDVLRERKRDALVAYLLAGPPPADAPSAKWENANDLYAYHLLDVEMGACQLTSRLVQASGSVQLFVQRCFMGLEPGVVVQADGQDGDSAWRWWKWMRRYRVWEANRKVFLWPENWIRPELKRDRSSFMKDLESELVQNEVTERTVEAAFATYLRKLDGVARLEIAGCHQEDVGDDTIVHVFGRTRGTEPHEYYHRRFDFRQWTPWEKVELDIQGDYLVPAVVGGRLFLFWPVFAEIPDEEGNSTVSTPTGGQSSVELEKTTKRLKLQLAVSDLRDGKWTPKRVSAEAVYSSAYEVEIVRSSYAFVPIDRSAVGGDFTLRYTGHSVGSDGEQHAYLEGAFRISGCHGVPEPDDEGGQPLAYGFRPERASVGLDPEFHHWTELRARDDAPEDDLAFEGSERERHDAKAKVVLERTPRLFRVFPGWQLSAIDRYFLRARRDEMGEDIRLSATTFGTWLPFFYADATRTFFALPVVDCLPALRQGEGKRRRAARRRRASHAGSGRYYYPDVKRRLRELERQMEVAFRDDAASLLGGLTPAQIAQLELDAVQAFPDLPGAPLSEEELLDRLTTAMVRRYRWFFGTLGVQSLARARFDFRTFYHPFVCDFAKLVEDPLQGVPALMRRETQLHDRAYDFARTYQPTQWVLDPAEPEAYPREDVDFRPDGAYAAYNWELFFHLPLLIADTLSRNQRFEEARDWYHLIFNPVGVESAAPGGSAMSKYWITKPFFETTDPQYVQQRVENVLRMLAGDTAVPGASAQLREELEDQVRDWRTNPFEPHRIANYRTVAYQKTTVMRYLDNLIAWGDHLFRQDSMESINEATQLYVLAAEILGPPPKRIPPRVKPPVETFFELEHQLDDFANALVEVENLVPAQTGSGAASASAPPLPTLYFCIPPNDTMLGYWETVADRLYKIRHCMNIEGVARQLALFEPPIDPGALVKAVAGGLDVGAALADLDAPLPLYRYEVLQHKANEVCADVKALGAALLAALEKRDGEALARLRQSQEIRALQSARAVREQQIEVAAEALEASKTARDSAKVKKRYYESRTFMNVAEGAGMALSSASAAVSAGVAIGYVAAGGLRLVPQFLIGASGFGGSPHATGGTGGASFGASGEDVARTLEAIAATLEKGAGLSNTIGSYMRRMDDWQHEAELATVEIEQLDRQIAGDEVRLAVAEKELENHDEQVAHATALDEFMRSKYTNEELYQWHVGQISGVYFQSYKLAYDLARRAERCLRFELGVPDTRYISFGHWDSLKKGLLAGEKLQYDLRRMDAGYLEQNRRELELAKNVSLAQLDPLALVRLRETGRCFFRVPEEAFDLDYPGHYYRRLKSVSLTLPAVAGPHTTVSCTLRLLRNSVRTTTQGDYPHAVDDDGVPVEDPRFVESNVPVKSIATSTAQNDDGLFELRFDDPRYLPFERAGAISEWSLELMTDLPSNNPDPAEPDFGRPLRQFDYDTIADAILHLRYTAREDAGAFKNRAITHLRDHLARAESEPGVLLLNLRRDFPTEWSRFLHPTAAGGNVFELDVSRDLFPVRDAGETLQVDAVTVLARCTDAQPYKLTATPPLPEPPPAGANVMTLVPNAGLGGLHFAARDVTAEGVEVHPHASPVTWRLRMTRPGGGDLAEDPVTHEMEVEDLIVVLAYHRA